MAALFPAHWASQAADMEVCATPVGEDCSLCEEPIQPGDEGIVMPHYDENGIKDRPSHRACFLASLGIE